ncbi:MAG: tRNA (cytidine(56)-2'-O)-methyltransferase [Nitrososphaerales archaeon]
MKVVILRIGHRYVRDYRVTTHVALVARAFGAEKMVVVNVEGEIKKTIKKVNERWGGDFEVEEVSNWKSIIKEWKDTGKKIVHLTMYGINVDYVIEQIKKDNKDLMIVIGAEKVPKELYDISNYNVSISTQPHSEIAALAIFLDRFFEGKQLKQEFKGKMKIVPTAKGIC